MKDIIQQGLHQIGDHSSISEIRQVSGGDINQAFYVKTEAKDYFMKGNQNVPPHFFKAEADGLELIRQTDTISVPAVHYYDEPEKGAPGILIMDWINGEKQANTPEMLGTRLAQMHQYEASAYGLNQSTFVGTIPQENEWCDTWTEYYRNYRLRPQMELAVQKNRLDPNRHQRLDQLITLLERWIPEKPSASLLHGDLWGGNWMAGSGGEPFLIDPSIVYGDPAFELAFTELFGGFPDPFYKAYQETSPLPDNYDETQPLYQLFYLLVHLNLFGETYGPSVDRILARYVG